ncbi:MAG: HD domain-containing protein [Candidatus Acidiferrales bacterium]
MTEREAMQTFQSILTDRFDSAFQLASGLHREQCRKGTGIPYISHLMSVAALVLEAGGDEDQVIAALLHDAMEDQGGPPTLETIRRLFGDRVAEIVKECSDSESEDPENKLPWHQRKLRPRHFTSTFSSITIYGNRRFARAEDRRRLAGFDRARSRRLVYDSNCR